MIFATTPPQNTLPLPVAKARAVLLMRRASFALSAENWQLTNCKKTNLKNAVCLYSITVPKNENHPHEVCVGKIFLRKPDNQKILVRVIATVCIPIKS